jgi:hypothetical protein
MRCRRNCRKNLTAPKGHWGTRLNDIPLISALALGSANEAKIGGRTLVNKVFELLLSFFVLCLPMGIAKANFIATDFPPLGAKFLMVQGLDPAATTYDATTETFTATTQYSAANVDKISPLLEILVHDIVGSFSLTAKIDNAGTVLGGSFAVTGQSLTLGITTPMTLVSGKILDGGEFQFAGLELLTTVTALNSNLQSLIGPVRLTVLDIFGLPTNFNHSFSGLTATEAPAIYLVTEPATVFLFAIGLALFGLCYGRWPTRRG